MIPADGQRLRQRLHEELGALQISPPPVLRVTGRGQGIRLRRRVLTAGTAIAAVVVVAAAAYFNRAAPAQPIRLNPPNPAAPGGVFASGTADGRKWALAVRNIAARPGTPSCLPAVMFNGRYGDVLYQAQPGTPPFGNPALLARIPGFPGIGVIFTQVAVGDGRLVGTFPGRGSVTARPVLVRACGRSFNLAGYAFDDSRGITSEIVTYNRFGPDKGIVLSQGGGPGTLPGPEPAGIWSNLDKSRADNRATQAQYPIGAGNVGSEIWHIRTSLGLSGQCYTATLRGGRGRGQSGECVPVAAPPRTATLSAVPISGARMQLPGFAGLVTPRAARAVVSVDNGTDLTVRPVTVAGRSYLAFAVPPHCRPYRLALFDAAGHRIATTTALPPPAN